MAWMICMPLTPVMSLEDYVDFHVEPLQRLLHVLDVLGRHPHGDRRAAACNRATGEFPPGGTNPLFKRPWESSTASHWQSFMALFRPGKLRQ
jgi:hypothetical protein